MLNKINQKIKSIFSKQDKKDGFTIIEVVMVLAIAGLIFAVVFAAVPRLQTSRRDNQRKRDTEAIYGALVDYQSNAGKSASKSDVTVAFTGTNTSPFFSYVDGDNLEDPEGKPYERVDNPTEPGQFNYEQAKKCSSSGGSGLEDNPGNNNYAVVMKVERGFYCVDTGS